MDFLTAAILGIVEGLTEFLPISSTGHLILTSRILGLRSTEFLKSFEIAIQLGAILAVIALYGRTKLLDPRTLRRVMAAFIPTALVGFFLYPLIKRYLLGNPMVVLASLFIGGLVLIVFERFYRRPETAVTDTAQMTYRQAVFIGICQSLAVIPGVSRAAATIVGGLCLGIDRTAIVEFSFLLAVPTMLAATALDLLKSGIAFTPNEAGALGVGFVTSFLVAMACIRWMMGFVRSHGFTVFGVYRILAAVLFWIFV